VAWQGVLENNSNNNSGLVHRAQITNQQREYACGRNGVLRGFADKSGRAKKNKQTKKKLSRQVRIFSFL
jgi:hypothetical protein